jgi:hypothetical protein
MSWSSVILILAVLSAMIRLQWRNQMFSEIIVDPSGSSVFDKIDSQEDLKKRFEEVYPLLNAWSYKINLKNLFYSKLWRHFGVRFCESKSVHRNDYITE